MNDQIIFAYPGNEKLAEKLSTQLSIPLGRAKFHRFPDQETLLQIQTEVKNKDVVVVCSLYHPDEKFLPLHFLLKTAKELGANRTFLVTPYLGYMRQDKRFNPGEAITSELFASLISESANGLITVDPHLHRRGSMDEIYSIPTKVVHAAPFISKWIMNNIESPVLIGPDSESKQWVSEVADNANAPYIVLNKKRLGDNKVEVSVPEVSNYKNHTPVLVDDIISTARTMIETIKHLQNSGMKSTVCIGVHPIFANDAYENLMNAGAEKVVSCNTIPHKSNEIDISELIVKSYQQLRGNSV